MSDDPYNGPDRKPTNKLGRVLPGPRVRPIEESKAFARTAEDDIITLARCPLCEGACMVPPEVAVAFERIAKEARDRQ